MKIFLALILLIGLGLGVYIYSDIASQPASVIVTTVENNPADDIDPVATEVIIRTTSGYEPREIVITKGTSVVWKNDSGDYHWPASDFHPSHNEYPDFDSKRPIAIGEEWSFTFGEVGEWGFHDHLRGAVTGVILVVDPEEEAFSLEEDQILEQVVE